MTPYTLLATTETAASGGLLEKLGIDGWTLLFQAVAFLILVFVLGKWVYPVFIGIIDKRQADIEAGRKAAEEAKEKASSAEAEVAEALRQARAEASDIIATAKQEASTVLETAEQRAKTRADNMVEAAQADIDNQVRAAKESLKQETLQLVTMATEKVLGKAMTKGVDESLVKDAVKEAQ